MMGPAGIDRYVSLVTEKEIPTEAMRAWFKCVSNKAPYGVVSTFQSIDNSNQPQTVRMVHRETKDAHYYMIPITRDLMEYEAQRIVDAWMADWPDDDCDIEVTVVPTKPFQQEDDTISVEQQKYSDLAVSWAKRQHEEWMDAKVKEGWRYSITMDADERTHPLLRPWEDLPDQYRKVDLTQPQKFVDLMTDQGYAVVPKADLEAVQRVLRGL